MSWTLTLQGMETRLKTLDIPALFMTIALVALTGVMSPSTVLAEEACAVPADTATDKTADTAAAPTENPALAWLDKIDAAGRALKSLHGELRYEVIQGALGDKQIRLGSLFYDANKPAKFAVHFDRLVAGRRLLREDRWYIFDGRWMVEKMGEQKQFIKREFTDPKNENAKEANPLTDGQGPFALPITLQKDQVLQKYKVQLLRAPTDENATLKLRLTPHVAQRGQFTQIDLTYDAATMMPSRVETLDETENETAVILTKVKVDQPIDAAVFDTNAPAAKDGWTVEIKPWGE